MDKAEFINEIENILHENGAIKELQTKIRSELIEILLNKKQLQPCKDVTDVDKSVNLMIIEHLMQNGLWYTASIMASFFHFWIFFKELLWFGHREIATFFPPQICQFGVFKMSKDLSIWYFQNIK